MALVLAVLLLTGGVAFWNLQQPAGQKLPEGVAATQDKKAVVNHNGAAANEKNEQGNKNSAAESGKKVAAVTDEKEQNAAAGNHVAAGTGEVNQNAGSAVKAAPPLVSSDKSDSAKESVAGRADAVQFSGSNWNVFQKTEQHLGPRVANADKVVYPPGQWPQITIQNNSDVPLKNPQAVLTFNDFGVVGSDFSATDYADKVISSKLAGKGENGVARTVTLRYDGTVPPHESYRLNLFGGISGLFKTGANPSVRIVFSADNADIQEKDFRIQIK